MALIKCPECKKKISDQCDNCPSCGYPIKVNFEKQNLEIENNQPSEKVVIASKPFYKKVWFWIIAGVVLVALVIGTILFLNRDTKPKLDKNGNPVFVELTDEVYTNAKKYLGYHINIKGEVFQVIGDNGNVKGVQIWLDPDTCEQNLMIYYNTDIKLKQGDYIICTGYIDSISKYDNAYGAKLSVPLVYSSDLRKATYIEVMAPTTATITPENLKQEKYGYSILIDKVEFSEKETRVYVTATNSGKSEFYVDADSAVIVQNGKQYEAETNFEANYEEIPYSLVKGVKSSGIIVFPTIKPNDFDLTIEVRSDDYDEKLEKFVFKVSTEKIEAPATEENKVTKPSSSDNIVDRNERMQQAVNVAKSLANENFPTNRIFLQSLVHSWFYQIDFDYFSDFEVDEAIDKADIDWGEHALGVVQRYTDTYHSSPKELIIYWLERYETYTIEEQQYAIDNCGIDWNKIAVDRVEEIVARHNNGDELLTVYDICDELVEMRFSSANIDYAIEHTSGYDMGEAIE